MLKDLRYALRSFAKRPGFAIVAILTLALGIGVNSALFTVFNAFVWKPLPVKNPDQLVNFDGRDSHGHASRLFSYPDFKDYQKRTDVFSDVIAWNQITVTLGEAPPNPGDDSILNEGYEYLFGQIVSDNYFTMLGADMELGRGFGPAEDQRPGASPVVVLSHKFWARRFQSDPTIVGKTISLHGVPFQVVGVTAPSFGGLTPDLPSFWVPLMMRDDLMAGWGHGRWLEDRNTEVFVVVGRLAPGVTRKEAEVALQLTTTQLADAYPAEGRKTKIALSDGGTFVKLDEDFLPLITPLLIGFGLVLVIACANVANLLLVRAVARQREIAVRLALGGSRWRIIRQLITESLLLSITGGFAGLIVSLWTISTSYPLVLTAFSLPPDIANNFTINLTPDWRMFAFTLLIASVAGLLAGLAPALQFSKPEVLELLKDESSTFAGKISQSRLRGALVIAQIAVCFALLTATGLLVENSLRLQAPNTGMVTRNVFGVSTGLAQDRSEKPNPDLATDLRQQLAQRLRNTPGVLSVSHVYRQPLSGQMDNTLIALGADKPNHFVETQFNLVSADYFQTMSLPIVRGRSFTEDEVRSKARVVVVSEEIARRYWPGGDAVGQQIGIADRSQKREADELAENKKYEQWEVIGVAREARNRWVWRKDDRMIYLPLPPNDPAGHYLLVRTESDSAPVMAQVRSMLPTIDPRLRASAMRIDDNIAFQTAPFRAIAWLSGALGVLALLLCSVGLYGVVSFMVASRTKEIGIRVALGAKPVDVIRMFTFHGLKLTSIGMACGLVGGVIISRLLAAALIDVSPIDPLAYSAVAVFLLLISLIAILVPARRATGVDAMEALRYE
jgi:predicted permease